MITSSKSLQSVCCNALIAFSCAFKDGLLSKSSWKDCSIRTFFCKASSSSFLTKPCLLNQSMVAFSSSFHSAPHLFFLSSASSCAVFVYCACKFLYLVSHSLTSAPSPCQSIGVSSKRGVPSSGVDIWFV